MATSKHPDDNIVALFKNHAIKNEGKSAEAGRPIFDDMEIVELRYPGSRNVGVYPATAMSQWEDDGPGSELRKLTYAERFSRQYQQFKAHSAQTKSGTPLDYATFLTEGRRAELRAQNIYTVEALAAIDGQELKNLGTGGREMKNRAAEFLAESDSNAVNTRMAAKLEALEARNSVLEEDLDRLKASASEGEFADMSLEQLRDYIKATTGHAPLGSLHRKNLIKLAISAKKTEDTAA
jgi:hypothetical protein